AARPVGAQDARGDPDGAGDRLHGRARAGTAGGRRGEVVMRYWLRGKAGGLLAFILIAVLVIGGLGWVTAAALRLEEEHLQEQAQVELQGQLQLALSLLDSRVRPLLAREDSRPYNHYSAIYAPSVAFTNDGTACASGTMLEPSPLLNADLPVWMLLHFQADED